MFQKEFVLTVHSTTKNTQIDNSGFQTFRSLFHNEHTKKGKDRYRERERERVPNKQRFSCETRLQHQNFLKGLFYREIRMEEQVEIEYQKYSFLTHSKISA